MNASSVPLFIDTNIFLRYYEFSNEKMHAEVKPLILAVSSGAVNAYTGTMILSEMYYVLTSHYKLDRISVLKILEKTLTFKGLILLDNYRVGLSISLGKQYNIKFIDCLIASIKPIYDKKMIIVSYDKDFDKIGVIRKTPDQIIKTK